VVGDRYSMGMQSGAGTHTRPLFDLT